MLNYHMYEVLLEAAKKFTEKEGRKDIAFRTDAIDFIIEYLLLGQYTTFVWNKLDEVKAAGTNVLDMSFWRRLHTATAP